MQNSTEQAENLIKQQEAFITTLDANDEKINAVVNFAQRLMEENHYAADKIQQKADTLQQRYCCSLVWSGNQLLHCSSCNM